MVDVPKHIRDYVADQLTVTTDKLLRPSDLASAKADVQEKLVAIEKSQQVARAEVQDKLVTLEKSHQSAKSEIENRITVADGRVNNIKAELQGGIDTQKARIDTLKWVFSAIPAALAIFGVFGFIKVSDLDGKIKEGQTYVRRFEDLERTSRLHCDRQTSAIETHVNFVIRNLVEDVSHAMPYISTSAAQEPLVDRVIDNGHICISLLDLVGKDTDQARALTFLASVSRLVTVFKYPAKQLPSHDLLAQLQTAQQEWDNLRVPTNVVTRSVSSQRWEAFRLCCSGVMLIHRYEIEPSKAALLAQAESALLAAIAADDQYGRAHNNLGGVEYYRWEAAKGNPSQQFRHLGSAVAHLDAAFLRSETAKERSTILNNMAFASLGRAALARGLGDLTTASECCQEAENYIREARNQTQCVAGCFVTEAQIRCFRISLDTQNGVMSGGQIAAKRLAEIVELLSAARRNGYRCAVSVNRGNFFKRVGYFELLSCLDIPSYQEEILAAVGISS